MKTGRGGVKGKESDGFTRRTVAVMATEMAEARARMNRVCVQFEALAKAHGVKVDWENTIA